MSKLEKYRDLLFDKKSIAMVAIVKKNGNAHVSPLWFNLSEDDMNNNIIYINTATGRVKAKNLEIGSKIAISIIDPENAYRYLGFEGTILDLIMGEEANDHIDALSLKYFGKAKYGSHIEGERRIKIPIKIDHIYH